MDQPLVLLLAVGGAEAAEIDIASVNTDLGKAGRSMELVGRNFVPRHRGFPKKGRKKGKPSFSRRSAVEAGSRKSRLSNHLYRVERTGRRLNFLSRASGAGKRGCAAKSRMVNQSWNEGCER